VRLVSEYLSRVSGILLRNHGNMISRIPIAIESGNEVQSAGMSLNAFVAGRSTWTTTIGLNWSIVMETSECTALRCPKKDAEFEDN